MDQVSKASSNVVQPPVKRAAKMETGSYKKSRSRLRTASSSSASDQLPKPSSNQRGSSSEKTNARTLPSIDQPYKISHSCISDSLKPLRKEKSKKPKIRSRLRNRTSFGEFQISPNANSSKESFNALDLDSTPLRSSLVQSDNFRSRSSAKKAGTNSSDERHYSSPGLVALNEVVKPDSVRSKYVAVQSPAVKRSNSYDEADKPGFNDLIPCTTSIDHSKSSSKLTDASTIVRSRLRVRTASSSSISRQSDQFATDDVKMSSRNHSTRKSGVSGAGSPDLIGIY